MGRISHARLQSPNGQPARFQGMRVEGHLDGLLFQAQAEQRFSNDGDSHLELIYTFPLPARAVLLGVELQLGERWLSGSVLPRAEAVERHEDALADGDAAILLEQNADLSHCLNLGNLAPGEDCTIRLRYAQILAFEQGSLRLLIPTVIAPRYGDAEREVGLLPHQVPVRASDARHAFDLTLHLHGALAGARLASPSHPIRVHQQATGEAPLTTVELARHAWLDRDFVLLLDGFAPDAMAIAAPDHLHMGTSRKTVRPHPSPAERAPQGAHPSECCPHSGDGQDHQLDGKEDSDHGLGHSPKPGSTAVLAAFCPQIRPAEAPAPISLKILVDCSGSMHGDSIESARRALLAIIPQLGAQDRFSLSRFGHQVEHLGRRLWKSTPVTRDAAQRWIAALEADMGGTEMAAALGSTFAHAAATAHARPASPDLLLITDGEISDIEGVLTLVRGARHRLFIIGIGSSPAETHLRRLADATGGACDFVAPGESAEPAILRMFARVRSTRLQDLEIEWPGQVRPAWASPLPASIFDGDTLPIFASFDGMPAGIVRLWGHTDDGRRQQIASLTLPASPSAGAADAPPAALADTLPRMLAHARIRSLQKITSAVPDAPRPADEGETWCLNPACALTREEARTLALHYQLVTADTSFVLVHVRADEDKASGMPARQRIGQMLAAGWGGEGSVLHAGGAALSQRAALTPLPVVWHARRAIPDLGDAMLCLSFDAVDPSADGPGHDHEPGHFRHSERWMDSGLTPLGLRHWLAQQTPVAWPDDRDGLMQIGVPLTIVDWLLRCADARRQPESAVIAAFLQAVRQHIFPGEPRPGGGAAQRPACPPSHRRLAVRMRAALAGMTPLEWPSTLTAPAPTGAEPASI